VTFRQALADLGYTDRKNFIIQEWWQPQGKADWLPDAIADITRADVHAIFALGAIPARALKAAGTTIPTVFVIVIPTAEFVSRPERPEGAMTGFTVFDPNLPRQQLELLKVAVPQAQRIAILGDEAVGAGPFAPYESAARSLGLEPLVVKLRATSLDFDGTFEHIKRERADAIVVLQHPIIGVHQLKIGEYAKQFRLPSLFPAGSAEAGGLLTYGSEFTEGIKLAAKYIDRILRGTKPSELPVQTVYEHKLIVNLATARALGVEISPSLLHRADLVKE
jgi:putative ABC transport system substrate-binding protein